MFRWIAGQWTDMLAHARAKWLAEEGERQSAWARETLRIAQGELGLGEEGANNMGKHVAKWGRGRTNIAWCAAFACWCVEEAATSLGWRIPLFEDPRWAKWRLSAKSSWRELGKLGQHVVLPLPGDLALFERGRDGDWRGHIEITETTVPGTNRFQDIAGNLGEFPAIVKKQKREIGRHRYIGHVRLPDIRTVGERI